jgi:hypothetical protein
MRSLTSEYDPRKLARAEEVCVAVTKIAYKPGLTKDEAQEIFRRQFEPRYSVENWKGASVGAPRDFVLNKNPFVGIAVKLQQSDGETKFVYTGYAPKLWARMLFTGLISFLIWNGPTNEVREFIESAPEFQ